MLHKVRTMCRVLLILVLGKGAVCLSGCEPAVAVSKGIVVETRYPGMAAQEVAESVGVPIEAQLHGMEHMLRMTSRCTDDGGCTVTLTFANDCDLGVVQTYVQNRVNLALPVLPEVVRQGGVSVKKRPAGMHTILFLSSPDASRDNVHLGNYAHIQFKDELTRVPGVAGVTLFGAPEYSLRIWLDPDRLAARELTASDVVKAIEKQKAPEKGDPGAQASTDKKESNLLSLPVGSFADTEKLSEMVVRTDTDGRAIRLSDVARVQLGAARADAHVTVDGKPGVALGIFAAPDASPGATSRALQDLTKQLRARLPAGVDLHTAFDFSSNLQTPNRTTTPEYVLVDLDPPPDASSQRIIMVLERAATVMRSGKEIERVLATTEELFERTQNRPCLLVQLVPSAKRKAGREEVVQAIRAQLHKQVPEMAFRIRDLSGRNGFPRCGYPIDMAVQGPEADRVREFASKLAERLRASGKLMELWLDPESMPRPRIHVDIDRKTALEHGISLNDINSTLQVFCGGLAVTDCNLFGRTWQVNVQAGPGSGKQADDINRLQVRNDKGEMVAMSKLATVRDTKAPPVIHRLNGEPMIELTANPAPATALAEVRTLCDSAAQRLRAELHLPATYQLVWLGEITEK